MLSHLPSRFKLSARVRHFVNSRLLHEAQCVIADEKGSSTITAQESKWHFQWDISGADNETLEIHLRFHHAAGVATNVGVALGLEITEWSSGTYVFSPAALYDGNRFPARKIDYPPLLDHPSNLELSEPPIITDVPRLNPGHGASRAQFLAGDAALPCLGFFDPKHQTGVILITDQFTPLGQTGLAVEESSDRSSALFVIGAPGVRCETFYRLCSTSIPSTDRGIDSLPGATHSLRARITVFPARKLQTLFTKYHEHRLDLVGKPHLTHDLPFSAAFEIIEQKYNRDNWREENGYYSVGLRNDRYQDWQAGWVGGLISTYPLLFAGDENSRARARKTLDFGLSMGTARSGFFRSCCFDGHWFGDGFHYPGCDHYHMTRKSADVLFFLIKQFDLLQKQDPAVPLSPSWREGARKCADAFVLLWKRSGEFGQFVDGTTGEMIIGGSASAALAIGALAWASVFFEAPEYLRIAQEAGASYHRRFVQQGLLNGGPGEILQCPDSESAIAMVESFVALWEVTGNRSWLEPAAAAAEQCLTWQMPYDFVFPPTSLFGRLGMRTTGSIWANVQNKHSAPGFCTLSGDSLFKLFRATGRKLFLDAIRATAHNLTQYLSRVDRPIGEMPSGWINERVNTSDWLEPPGEIFCGSCWPEVSCLLSYVELPGVYLRTDNTELVALDHVEAQITSIAGAPASLQIHNPTRYPLALRLFAENKAQSALPLGLNGLFAQPVTMLSAGQTRKIIFTRPD